MEDRIIITNAKIWDKFDLPIQEDVEDNNYYTSSEIKHEVEKRIARLATLGGYYTILPTDISKYEIIISEDVIANVEPIGAHAYVFRISKAAARKRNKKYLDNIIYHELCHILQTECLITLGFLYYNRRVFML